MRNINQLFVFLLGMTVLLGHCEAANPVTPMVSAQNHVLALKSDGTVYAWGRNNWGELGDGTTAVSASPSQIIGLSNVKSVLATGEASFVVKQDGTVFGWGVFTDLTPSHNSRTPIQLQNLSNVIAVAVGYKFFSLKADGTVQEGFDAVPVPGLANITAISGNVGHSLALRNDGTVWAWGQNASGQLGDGTTTNRTAPVQVSSLSDIVAISAGDQHNLALKADGTVWAWGDNSSAQLGDGTTTSRLTPTLVQGLSNATSISAGSFHSTAIRSDGTVWDWGQSSIRGVKAPPGEVSGISNAIATVATSNSFTIVLNKYGTLSTWGNDNSYGTFGNGRFGGNGGQIFQVVSLNLLGGATQNALPSAVFTMTPENSGSTTFTVRCDASNSSDPDGAIVTYTWTTSNGGAATGKTPTFNFSQPGNYVIELTVTDDRGDTTQSSATVLLPQVTATPAIARGYGNALTIKSDGTLLTWGSNEFGQLGTGKTSASAIPVLVASLNGVKAVAGSYHTLALRQDGTVWAWGDNQFSELGIGSTSGRSLVPLRVSNLTDVKAIAAGWLFSLAVKSDGTIWQWGSVAGTTSSIPSQVQGLTNVISVAAGLFHKLALKGDGTVWVWGDNQYGQYGDGTTTFSPDPVQVPGLQNVVTISAGGTYSLALQSDGSVWMWGDNRYGQLGIEPTSPVVAPTKVQGLNQVVGISGGDILSNASPLALRADGTVYRFRYNSSSQILGLRDITAVADGIALRSDGTVFTWDDNYFNNSDGSLGDGTFARRDGLGLVINQDGSGFLDLIPNVADNTPSSLKVPFFVSTLGGITATIASINTTTKFNTADAGKPGAVFVTAMAPKGTLNAAPLAIQANASHTTALAAPIANTFELMQLTQSGGWQPVVNGQLLPYATGVLGDQLATQTILSNTNTANLKGAEFCLGYGANAAEMTSAGRMRAIATIPNPDTTGTAGVSCVGGTIPISDARVFAYAEANYPNIFAETGTTGLYQQYNYRYYPASENYLAIDTSGVISMLGSSTKNVLLTIGPVESFRSLITAWESTRP